jgi:group I intron endonuclease
MIIYKITNSINGKVYIGQTVQKNPKMRWYDHQAKARCGVNQPLFNAIRKYGVEKFSWEVIDQANSLEELNKLEEQYVEQYNSIHTGYNIRKAGGNKLHNKASIEKMRESQREAHARRRAKGCEGGWKRCDGGAMKGKSHPGKGTKRTQEQITRIKAGQQNMLNSEKGLEYRRKQSENSKRMWVERKLKMNGGI